MIIDLLACLIFQVHFTCMLLFVSCQLFSSSSWCLKQKAKHWKRFKLLSNNSIQIDNWTREEKWIDGSYLYTYQIQVVVNVIWFSFVDVDSCLDSKKYISQGICMFIYRSSFIGTNLIIHLIYEKWVLDLFTITQLKSPKSETNILQTNKEWF